MRQASVGPTIAPLKGFSEIKPEKRSMSSVDPNSFAILLACLWTVDFINDIGVACLCHRDMGKKLVKGGGRGEPTYCSVSIVPCDIRSDGIHFKSDPEQFGKAIIDDQHLAIHDRAPSGC